MSISQATVEATPRPSKENRGCLVTLATIAVLGPAAWFGGSQIAKKWIVPQVKTTIPYSPDVEIESHFRENGIPLPVRPIAVKFLGQSHAGSKDKRSLLTKSERVIESQIKIADYLARHPESIVFEEQLSRDWPAQMRDEILVSEGAEPLEKWGVGFKFAFDMELVRTFFPKGWPKDSSQLNEAEKGIVARIGAPIVLYFLGVLPELRAATSPELQ